jgi:predicted permease
VDEEIDAHLRMSTQERVERGVPPGEAWRQACLELGSVRAVREESRSVWSFGPAEQLATDLRSGLHVFTRSPAFSLTAVVLLALVIGGNATVFSVVNGLTTRHAPGVTSTRLVSVAWRPPGGGVPSPATSFPLYRAIAEQGRRLDVAAFRDDFLTLHRDGGNFATAAALVSSNYFEVLGVHPQKGRSFTEAEGALDGHGLVAMVSDRLWKDRFGSAEDIVGRRLTVDGLPMTVVGVTPPGFQGVWLAEGRDLWVPQRAFARAKGTLDALYDPAQRPLDGLVARLAEGATIEEAAAEVAAIAAAVPGRSAYDPPAAPVLLAYSAVAGTGNEVERYAPRFLRIFSILTLATVLVVCANVANLAFTRAISRQREMAVRQAFGASRARIARLVVAEGLAVGVAATAGACLVAWWTTRSLSGLLTSSRSDGIAMTMDFTPDGRVAAYALGLALVGALGATLAAAMRSSSAGLLDRLKAGERGVAPRPARAIRVLVACQITSAAFLMVLAGLAYRSLTVVREAPTGFPTAGLLLVMADTRAAGSSAPARSALRRRIVARLRDVSGVAGASHATFNVGPQWPTLAVAAGGASPERAVEYNLVGPGYFRVLGVPLEYGVEFGEDGADPASSAIVNRALAEALWPGQPALGRAVTVGDDRRSLTVIGVAPDVLPGGLRSIRRPPFLFVSGETAAADLWTTFYVRHAGGQATVEHDVVRAIGEVAPGLPLHRVTTFDTMVQSQGWTYRTLAQVLAVFAGLSLLVAAIGQYAALAFAVRQRRRELAVRIAVGASPRAVIVALLRDGLVLTFAGAAGGLALALAAGHAARALLHGVAPADGPTCLGVLGSLAIVSMCACGLPAVRAARVDPLDALRTD